MVENSTDLFEFDRFVANSVTQDHGVDGDQVQGVVLLHGEVGAHWEDHVGSRGGGGLLEVGQGLGGDSGDEEEGKAESHLVRFICFIFCGGVPAYKLVL